MRFKVFVQALLVGLLMLSVASFGFATGQAEDDSGETKGPIVVASKIDTEGALLGNMIVQVLRDNGFEVVDNTEFGTTDVIRKAIISGEIDIYPEYTGNGAFFYPDSPRDVWKNAEEGYQTVKELDMEANNLVWLEPAPANNTWAIAVRRDLAQAEGLETLDDMAAYIQQGGDFKLAASEEFVSREDVLPSFEDTYGFDLSDDQLLTFSGGNTATTTQAAARETDGVNAAMAYGTDGQLPALGLKVMRDSKGVMPVYEPASLARAEIMDQYPEIADLLNPVFQSLDLETLQSLNSKIAVEGRDASQVAEEYLRENGFLN
ncbi:MAG: ABC transporter substrate-binding protein [Spirochaetes bacterium]|jgi:osmoprotectant transport system substrate-binding protein|nr:ABC transporter substrate-binding protein [Spirochaetota bacterium]